MSRVQLPASQSNSVAFRFYRVSILEWENRTGLTIETLPKAFLKGDSEKLIRQRREYQVIRPEEIENGFDRELELLIVDSNAGQRNRLSPAKREAYRRLAMEALESKIVPYEQSPAEVASLFDLLRQAEIVYRAISPGNVIVFIALGGFGAIVISPVRSALKGANRGLETAGEYWIRKLFKVPSDFKGGSSKDKD